MTGDTVIATPDPPSQGVHNPIHDADGANAAGYAGALVAGVRTYGWVAQTVTNALGSAWLEDGWIDFSLRRPLYANERVSISVDQRDSNWAVNAAVHVDGTTRVVLNGEAGLGTAPWYSELEPPPIAPGRQTRPPLPGYGLDNVPLHAPLTPLTTFVSRDAARAMVRDDLGLDAPYYLEPNCVEGYIHPYFLAGCMAPLTRHNFTYGPTIHVRSQIQHLAEAKADNEITVGAQIVDAYERNDHWYQVLDGVVSQQQQEIARIRHHTIFRPRGT